MTTLESIRESLPGYARDLQLNLGTVLTRRRCARADGAADLGGGARRARAPRATPPSAATCRRSPPQHLDAAHVNAAHAAAAVMAMNNVYYRFLHLVEDEEYAKLPARLRMNVIGNPASPRRTSSCWRSRCRRSTAAAPAWPRTSGSCASTG